MYRPQPTAAAGYTLIELLFALGLAAVLTGVAIPQVLGSIDASRARGAARFVSSRLMLARMQAVQRTTTVAVRFDTDARGYRMTTYQDGNRNGVRSRDIDLNLDREIEQPVRLFELFPDVDFALMLNGVNADPIQLGGSSLLSYTPSGTSTSGTVYIRGRDGTQYAVRVLGATGRTRLLRYDDRVGQWLEGF